MLVKELIDEFKKFPEDADVLMTELKHTNGYYRLSILEE